MIPNKTHYLSSAIISLAVAVVSIVREEYISLSVSLALAIFFLGLEIIAHRAEVTSSFNEFENEFEVNN